MKVCRLYIAHTFESMKPVASDHVFYACIRVKMNLISVLKIKQLF